MTVTGTADKFDGARMFARIARELASPADMEGAGRRVVELAKTLTGCDSAALWTMKRADLPRLRAATDPVAAEHTADALKLAKSGAEWDCLQTRSAVRVHDIRAEDRWPAYRDALLRSAEPTLSMTALPLDVSDDAGAALSLGSTQAGHFTEEVLALGSILAEHAAVSLSAALARENAASLELALTSNRRIGMALGVIMNQRRCTDDQAFTLLREASQHTHRKLRDVAEDVVFTGLLLEAPAARPEPRGAYLRSA
jgi:transcriptional regulator with GAF, ATPase, and Fis domain